MPRGVKKEHLPSKVCVICNRPFTWRKKWERCWDEVTTCSKSCNNQRRLQNKNNTKLQQQNRQESEQEDHGQQQQQQQQQQERSITNESTNRSETMANAETSTSVRETTDPKDTDTWSQNDEQELAELISAIQLGADTGTDINDDNDTEDKASDGQIDCISHGSDRGDDEITSQQQDPQEQQELNLDPIQQKKAERKAAKKRKKAERRAQREGRGDPSAGQKQCDMCGKSVNLLIRCMYEEGQTDWKMVCGSCWNVCSGGVVDGDKDHPHYRYGGLWKNRRRQ